MEGRNKHINQQRKEERMNKQSNYLTSELMNKQTNGKIMVGMKTHGKERRKGSMNEGKNNTDIESIACLNG